MFGCINRHGTALSLLDDTCGCSTAYFGINRPPSGATYFLNIQEHWYVKKVS
jgi:hypothetical protein